MKMIMSEYPFTNPLYNKKNKKVIGKMKDELNSIILEEYIGLRPKSYSLLFNGLVKDNILVHTNTSQKQAAKGTNTSVKEAHLRHKHFKDALENLCTVIVAQNVIKSKAHTISSYHQNKVSLTFDTKRWICEDNVHTLAHGHYTCCK